LAENAEDDAGHQPSGLIGRAEAQACERDQHEDRHQGRDRDEKPDQELGRGAGVLGAFAADLVCRPRRRGAYRS
jgi:hypothetical protein